MIQPSEDYMRSAKYVLLGLHGVGFTVGAISLLIVFVMSLTKKADTGQPGAHYTWLVLSSLILMSMIAFGVFAMIKKNPTYLKLYAAMTSIYVLANLIEILLSHTVLEVVTLLLQVVVGAVIVYYSYLFATHYEALEAPGLAAQQQQQQVLVASQAAPSNTGAPAASTAVAVAVQPGQAQVHHVGVTHAPATSKGPTAPALPPLQGNKTVKSRAV